MEKTDIEQRMSFRFLTWWELCSRLELVVSSDQRFVRSDELSATLHASSCMLVQRTFWITRRSRFVFSPQGIMLCCLSCRFGFMSVVVVLCLMPQNYNIGSALSFTFCYPLNKVNSALKPPKFGEGYLRRNVKIWKLWHKIMTISQNARKVVLLPFELQCGKDVKVSKIPNDCV